ncbi:MAG: hypothetical protein ACTHKG_00740 [Nocardioides sp.]
MRIPIRRLLAVMAAAIVCLTSFAFATAAHADDAYAVGFTSVGGAQFDDEAPDVGRARDEIVVQAPDVGRLRNEVVLPAPDLGRARNEVVLPEPATPAPAEPVDSGISADTWGLIGLGVVTLATIGAAVYMTRGHRHHGGQVAHPA